jgi:uncharacterized protein YndB with AHSA1/START domain
VSDEQPRHERPAEDETGRVEREVLLPLSAEEAWPLVSEPEHLEAWLAREVELELRTGGPARFVFDGDVEREGVVEAVEAPRRLVVRWWPSDGDGERLETTVELRLVESGEATRLVVVESGLAGLPQASACAALAGLGWELRLPAAGALAPVA